MERLERWLGCRWQTQLQFEGFWKPPAFQSPGITLLRNSALHCKYRSKECFLAIVLRTVFLRSNCSWEACIYLVLFILFLFLEKGGIFAPLFPTIESLGVDPKYSIPNGSSNHFFFFQGGLLGEIISSWKIKPGEEATFLQEKRN